MAKYKTGTKDDILAYMAKIAISNMQTLLVVLDGIGGDLAVADMKELKAYIEDFNRLAKLG